VEVINKRRKQVDLINGEIKGALLRFMVPFLLSNILQSLYGAVNVLMVGWFASTAHVSAVAVGSYVLHFFTFMIISICTGAGIIIGQYTGAKDEARVSDSVGTLILVALGMVLLVCGLLMFLNKPIIALMRTPWQAVEPARQYLLICTAGVPFIVGYNAVNSLMRGRGDSKTPLLFVAVASILNILLDLLLVGGFRMGAPGAAIATSVSQAASFLFAVLYFKQKGLPFSFRWRENIRWHPFLLKRMFKLGMPLALQSGLVNISFMLIMMIINSMGLTASAAVGVVDKIVSFAMLVPNSSSQAVSTMVAQNVGAGHWDRAIKTMRVGIGYSLIFAVATMLWAEINPVSLISLFTPDAAVIAIAIPYLRAFIIDCLLVSLVFNMNAYFNGRGKSLFTMAHSLCTTFLIRMPVAYFISLQPGKGLFEIGLAIPLATFVSLLFCLAYFWRLKSGPGAMETLD